MSGGSDDDEDEVRMRMLLAAGFPGFPQLQFDFELFHIWKWSPTQTVFFFFLQF